MGHGDRAVDRLLRYLWYREPQMTQMDADANSHVPFVGIFGHAGDARGVGICSGSRLVGQVGNLSYISFRRDAMPAIGNHLKQPESLPAAYVVDPA